MLPRLPFPLWFGALVALAARALVHALDLHALEGADVQVAFFAWIIPIATWVWSGIQVAAKVTLAALNWSVKLLWTFAHSTYSSLLGLGRKVLAFGHRAWQFFEGLYTDLLAPAWRKFWKLVDTARTFLERIFKPVLRVLFRLRHVVLDVYDKFVRPVLDTIDAVRQGLRLLSATGVDWARRLDDWLGRLQERINAPFLLALRKLNEVINIVNRITTADGFFQRLILWRSLVRYERDMWVVWLTSVRKREAGRVRDAVLEHEPPTVEEHAAALVAFVRDRELDDSAFAVEHAADMALWFNRNRVSLA